MMYFVTVPFASTVNFAIVKHFNHQDLHIKLLKLHIMKVSDLCHGFFFLFNISRAYSHAIAFIQYAFRFLLYSLLLASPD